MNDSIRRINLGFVNAYLVKAGEGFVLIDTGVAGQWERLHKALLEAGCEPGKLKLVVITHGDIDHAGSAARLQREYHLPIAMHQADAPLATGTAKMAHKAETLSAKLMLLFTTLAGLTVHYETFTPDILLEDGQSLAGYGLAARVIHAPGHTPGSIAVITEAGELFAGDTIDNRRKPGPAPFAQDFAELRKSYALLNGLGARRVYPGHGKPVKGEKVVGKGE